MYPAYKLVPVNKQETYGSSDGAGKRDYLVWTGVKHYDTSNVILML